jgi:bifunctional non-homologous end joining protein LigD
VPLDDYQAKRDFKVTPEPRGKRGAAAKPKTTRAPDGGRAADVRRFVIQEHHARALHWDLRLEHEGTLASWAVPKGIPADPHDNRLAVRTEDHPMEYLEFHGEIPRGQYGAGTMKVWDHGRYEMVKWEPREVIVDFSGERVRGRYVLFQTGGKQWMIHRMDPPEDPDRVAPPADFRPMRASAGKRRPSGDGWAFEMSWLGVRASALVQGGRVRVQGAAGDDVTAVFPELRGLGLQLGATEVLLDGVVTAIGSDGRPDHDAAAGRLAATDGRAAARLAKQVPAVLMVFDVVWLDGRLLVDRPYSERRRALEGLGLGGAAWQTPPVERGDGGRAADAARALGFDAIVAKRLDAVYEPGAVARAWVEVPVPKRAAPRPKKEGRA